MKQKAFSLICGLLSLFTVGCSTMEPGKHYGNTSLTSLKSAYVVLPDNDRQVGLHIMEALMARDVKVKAGRLDEKPSEVAFYVIYTDRWIWDLAFYLDSLEIKFMDGGNGQLIGRGAFKESWFHGYPDSKAKTFEIIQSIYDAK